MTKDEEQRVTNMLRAILGASHRCALSPKEAKKMKLSPGRLCDVCESDLKDYMRTILLPTPKQQK